ncbi:MAG: hypothetical protein ACRDSF_25755 [Pseudonocardiaceae bacterium]
MGLGLGAAAALGIAQTVPAAAVERWPVWSWSVAAGALTVSTFLGVGQGVLRWPWPAASCLAVLVAVAVVSATHRRRDAIAVGALQGMRERVTAAGGTVSAGPTPQGGFAVVVQLPSGGGGRW